jgi:hypothetical protein
LILDSSRTLKTLFIATTTTARGENMFFKEACSWWLDAGCAGCGTSYDVVVVVVVVVVVSVGTGV